MINFKGHTHIDTHELLKELDEYLMTLEGESKFDFLAFDTETNGVTFFRDVIIGFSLSPSPDQGFYIPLLEWVPDTSSQKVRKINKEVVEVFETGQFKDVWNPLQSYPENVTSKQYKVPQFIIDFFRRWFTKTSLFMHNAPFDCNFVLKNFGIDLAPNLQMDTILAKHFLDENTPNGLKSIASLWKKELGFNPEEDEIAEQRELGASVIRNGGTWNKKNKHVWRGDGRAVSTYAAKDTMLTFGVAMVCLDKFETELTEKQRQLFFEDEIMPLCREVVIPMRYKGMYIDVPYFEKLKIEVIDLLTKYEDLAQNAMKSVIDDFPLGESIEEAVSKKRFCEKIIELEELEYPYAIDKKTGKKKSSLAKKYLQEAQARDPHPLWGFMLGERDIGLSEELQARIKLNLYQEIIGRRFRFNAKSPQHLKWLFCDKLGVDPRSIPGTESSTPENHIPSFDAETLEELLLPKFPNIVAPILVYKKLEKLRSSYIEPALELHNEGYLCMDMKQYGTVSGRFSCSGGYNLQTLPKVEELGSCPKCESKNIEVCKDNELIANLKCIDCKLEVFDIICPSAIKKGFIAPPGFKIVNSDANALEPRCFAEVSGDPKLIAVYKEGLDFYSKIYCDMNPNSGYSANPKDANFLKKKNPELRQLVKFFALSVPYGSRDWQVANLMGLKKTITLRDGTEKEVVDVDKGRYYRELYLSAYPKLKQYMVDRERECITQGYVETIFGRRRRFQYAPEIFQIISRYGLTSEEFLDQRYKDLEFMNPKCGLKEAGLWQFAKSTGKDMWYIKQAGNWAYLQSLFKNELNNAKNAPIQGVAAHLINRAMLEAVRSFKNIGSLLVSSVHDELTCYSPEDKTNDTCQLLRHAMEQNKFAKMLSVPMLAEPIVCSNLKDSK